MLLHTSNAGGIISLLTLSAYWHYCICFDALLSETKELPFNVIRNNDKPQGSFKTQDAISSIMTLKTDLSLKKEINAWLSVA
jgi:hypothetical protein